MEQLGPVDTAIVLEGVDHLDRFRQRRGERRFVLVLGGTAPHKRVELGLRSAEVAAEALNADVAVVGAPKVTASRRVRVFPSPSDSELARLYNESRVAVAASRYEGFGLAAGEALRFGVPVVYAADGPLGFLIGDGGTGARPVAEEMAQAVVECWHRFESLSREAEREVDQLTWRNTASLVLDVIDDTIRGRHGALRTPSRTSNN